MILTRICIQRTISLKGALRDFAAGHPLNSFANAESRLFRISSVRILSPPDAKGSIGPSALAMLV